jgi:hypothetical protein
VDLITNFQATTGSMAATDDILNITDAVAGIPTTLIGKTVTDVTGANDTMMANGAWDANAKTFTFSADSIGADMLFAEVLNGTNDGIAAFTGVIILEDVKFSDLHASNFV